MLIKKAVGFVGACGTLATMGLNKLGLIKDDTARKAVDEFFDLYYKTHIHRQETERFKKD